MNLRDFERYIDPVILERGCGYYEMGAVVSIKQTEDHIWEAEVEGSDIYIVFVELNDREDIIYTVCDCPYDRGEYCKHQAAVFLTLRDLIIKNPDKNGCKPINDISSYEKPIRSGENAYFKIKQLLSERTKEELVSLLVGVALEYEEVRSRIELSFHKGTEKDELKKSETLIKTYIGKYEDDFGYIHYGDLPDAVKGAEMVLNNARCYFETEKTQHAVDLTVCVLHEMIRIIEHVDDSDGLIESIISQCFELLSNIAEKTTLSAMCRERIIDKLLAEGEDPIYTEWTAWQLDFIRISVKLANGSKLLNKVEERLTSLICAGQKENDGGFLMEQYHLIMLDIIQENEGKEKADEYVMRNIYFPRLRKKAIEDAFTRGNYEEAVRLTKDGEEHDGDNARLKKQWLEYRYKAYKITGETDRLRELAMSFVFDGSIDYYHELKSTYESSEWTGIYRGIIQTLEENQKTERPLYAEILIEEGEKEKLLEFVKKNVSRVKLYYRYLIPEYSDVVFKMFCQYIEYCAERADSRNGYRDVCAIIRDLKKAGGRTQANEIKEKLLKKYPRKTAFKDELSKV